MKTLKGIKGNIRDLSGQRFGKLTVLGFHDRIKSGKSHKIRWECLCDCGKKTVVRGDGLVSDNSKSCGCVATEKLIKNNKKRKKPRQEKGLKDQVGKYKWEAKKRNLEWSLTDAEAIKMFEQNCFYCDTEPAPRYTSGGSFNANGIDRKDNYLGYITDNCVPCCKNCNRAKLSMSLQDFYLWLTSINTSGPTTPFYLFKIKDHSGVSGDGVVAVGTIMPSGKAVMEWLGEHKSENFFDNIEQLQKIHSHEGDTILVIGNPKFHYIFDEIDVIKKMIKERSI